MPRFKPKRPPYRPKKHWCDECGECAAFVDLFGTNAICSACGLYTVLEGEHGLPAWPEVMFIREA